MKTPLTCTIVAALVLSGVWPASAARAQQTPLPETPVPATRVPGNPVPATPAPAPPTAAEIEANRAKAAEAFAAILKAYRDPRGVRAEVEVVVGARGATEEAGVDGPLGGGDLLDDALVDDLGEDEGAEALQEALA